ncbi:hypothetical protein [Ekhidna sp. To15]|uniref:hypothetical protein n=1 Tax=Ekhidna sp. To15 TaxID=3395267 RepID=UPI003F52454A
MKILKIFFLTILTASIIFSCTETEFASVGDQKFVAFSSTSLSVGESSSSSDLNGASTIGSNSVDIIVLRSTSDLSQALTVSINASAEYLEQSDFADLGEDASSEFSVSKDLGSLVIPAGEASARFSVITVDDVFPKGNKSLTLTITDVSDNSYNIGNANLAKSAVASVTLVDDDCPITIADWYGTYKVEEAFTTVNDPNGLGFFFAESYQLTFSENPSDVTLTSVIVTNSPGFDEYFPDGTILKFETCPGSVTFNGGTTILTALWNVIDFSETNSYDENSFKITASATSFGFGDYGFTLTKN